MRLTPNWIPELYFFSFPSFRVNLSAFAFSHWSISEFLTHNLPLTCRECLLLPNLLLHYSDLFKFYECTRSTHSRSLCEICESVKRITSPHFLRNKKVFSFLFHCCTVALWKFQIKFKSNEKCVSERKRIEWLPLAWARQCWQYVATQAANSGRLSGSKC